MLPVQILLNLAMLISGLLAIFRLMTPMRMSIDSRLDLNSFRSQIRTNVIGKAQILELVIVVVGVLVVLIMVGPTTGSSGILGNTTIAGNIRNGIAVVGSLFVVFVLFIFLQGIGGFGSKK